MCQRHDSRQWMISSSSGIEGSLVEFDVVKLGRIHRVRKRISSKLNEMAPILRKLEMVKCDRIVLP